MITEQINQSNYKRLDFEPLKIIEYNILGVKVNDQLDKNFRRTAIATVLTKDYYDLWDGNTIHLIELKHLYNIFSEGPTSTPYSSLIGQIIHVIEIRAPTQGDLNVVTWKLYPYVIPLNYTISEIQDLHITVKNNIEKWKTIYQLSELQKLK